MNFAKLIDCFKIERSLFLQEHTAQASPIGLPKRKDSGIKITFGLEHPPGGWGGGSQTLRFEIDFVESLRFEKKK